MKVTDFERIATVVPTQLGQIECPKCSGVCDERSPERRLGSRREWDCRRCGRGWIEVAEWVTSIKDALDDADAVEQHG